MVLEADFLDVAKSLEHGERVVEATADGFKGLGVGARFEENLVGVSTRALELKMGCLTVAASGEILEEIFCGFGEADLKWVDWRSFLHHQFSSFSIHCLHFSVFRS